jgi:hypothetical protein
MVKTVIVALLSLVLGWGSPNYLILARYDSQEDKYHVNFNKPSTDSVNEIRFYRADKVIKVTPVWFNSGSVGIDEYKMAISKSILDVSKVEKIVFFNGSLIVNKQVLKKNKTITAGPDIFYFYKSKKD